MVFFPIPQLSTFPLDTIALATGDAMSSRPRWSIGDDARMPESPIEAKGSGHTSRLGRGFLAEENLRAGRSFELDVVK